MSMRINVKLDSDVCDALMDFADENNLSLPEAINEALAEYFELIGEEEET